MTLTFFSFLPSLSILLPLDTLSRCLLLFHSDPTSPLATVTPCHCHSPLLSHAWLAWEERPIHGADLMKCIDLVTRPSLSNCLSDRLQQLHSSNLQHFTWCNYIQGLMMGKKTFILLVQWHCVVGEKISFYTSATKQGRAFLSGIHAVPCPCQSQMYLNYHWYEGCYITLCCTVWVTWQERSVITNGCHTSIHAGVNISNVPCKFTYTGVQKRTVRTRQSGVVMTTD